MERNVRPPRRFDSDASSPAGFSAFGGGAAACAVRVTARAVVAKAARAAGCDLGIGIPPVEGVLQIAGRIAPARLQSRLAPMRKIALACGVAALALVASGPART